MSVIVLVDMDGVLCDYVGGFLEIWRIRYPDLPYIPPDKQRSFNLVDDYPKELYEQIKQIENEKGFFRNLSPIPGSLGAVTLLNSLPGVEVFICSSPSLAADNCAQEKYQWIEAHLGREFTKRLILTKDKTLTKGRYLIDDKPDITGALTPEWEQLVYDQPYNRSTPGRRITWDNYLWLVRELLSR